MMFSLALSWLPRSTLMSEVCCRLTCTRSRVLTRGLFMVTEWWLLGEPPPWARRNYFAQNITNFVMSVPYYLAMTSVETTANHTTISTTWMPPWSSSVTSLFMLLFSTILTPWRPSTTSLPITSSMSCKNTITPCVSRLASLPTELDSTTSAGLYHQTCLPRSVAGASKFLLMDDMASGLMMSLARLTSKSILRLLTLLLLTACK